MNRRPPPVPNGTVDDSGPTGLFPVCHKSVIQPSFLERSFVGVRTAAALLLSLAVGSLAATAFAAEDAAPLAAARESVSQWVQTRQLISQTQAAWESDREMLGQSKALFERELKTVREQLSKVSTNSSVADQERLKSEADLKQHTDTLDAARSLVVELEAQVRQSLPILPPTLQATIKPLTDRLPADSATTKAGVIERLQTVVSLLNEIDKFNTAVSVFPEKQANAKGEPVAVDTLYLGLAGAWFVDSTGEVAGVGKPTPKGWEWKLQPEIAGKVRNAVAIYRSQKPAAFVALPASVQ
jgi:hypothetical protein